MEGIPIKISTIAGAQVQNNSRGWDSIISLLIVLLSMEESKLNEIIEVIRIKIVIVWSWKKISCSMRGDEAFWNLINDQEGISKRIIT